MADGGGQLNFFSDYLDDPLLPDGVPAFDGGQFSNWRANLLQPNQSKQLTNADIDKLGKLRTRRGTIRIGTGTAGTGTLIQGLTSFQTKDYNYVVAANGGKIWSFNGTTWDQIALGGTVDNEDILIQRSGLINQPTVPAGYTMGTTALVVDGITGVVGDGDKLYFMNNIRTEYFEYTIAAHTETAGNTTGITLEEPGLVFDVKDNWDFVVLRPAKVNNVAGYPAGATTIAIDGYTGTVNVGEKFIIKSENVTHTISAVSGTPTTSITFTPGLQADWAAADSTVPVVFAQGNDSLFFSDGVGDVYGWNGKTLMNLSTNSFLDELTQSNETILRTNPPTAVKVLLWFQNRLIASGIAAEPDAIYFSDFFDPTAWDKDYQQLRVGGGESDPITGLTAWTDLNMLVFKKNSIYVINLNPDQNQTPDDPTLLVASFSVKQIHKRLGCPAPLTAVQVGGGSSSPGSDIFFMDDNKKIRSVRRVLASETQQEIGEAVSLPIQDVLDRVNITWINRCVATYHNDHYFLAFPKDGATQPNGVVVYNLLTQSWCGEWTGWTPMCFSVRTDLGDYAKMIFGQSNGKVLQWLDDLALQEETPATYQDDVSAGVGTDIPTKMHTRAITFGNPYSFKTGLYVELEFDESVADLTAQVVLDKQPQPELLYPPFSTLSEPALTLPTPPLPFTLPGTPDLKRLAFDLQRYGWWRELQFMLSTNSKKLSMRSIRVSGFMDTLQLQTPPQFIVLAEGELPPVEPPPVEPPPVEPPPDPIALAPGIVCLTGFLDAGDPVHNFALDPMWTNPAVDCVYVRMSWARVEPHQHVSPTDFNWVEFDQCVTLAATYGKKLSLLVTAGLGTPAWVYAAGAYEFMTTLETAYCDSAGVLPQPIIVVDSIPDVFPSSGTIYVMTSDGEQTVTYTGRTSNQFTGCSGGTGTMAINAEVRYKEPMPLPWDGGFQTKWDAFLADFGARYDSVLTYVSMGGFGQGETSFFAAGTVDENALLVKAVTDGYANHYDAWLTGAKWVTDHYALRFPTTWFLTVLGAPYPTMSGDTALQNLINYGHTTYLGRFGIKSDILWLTTPVAGSLDATALSALSPDSPVGFQFQTDVITGDTATMLTILNRGIGFGAHFIEVYADDCADPAQLANLTTAGNTMKGI